MPIHRQLIGRITVGLLLVVVAAGCSRFGPQLYVDIENNSPKTVTVTVDSSGPGRTRAEDVVIHARGEGAAWHVPLGSTWEVKIDGKHVIGSEDRTGSLPSPGQQQDVTVSIRIDADGTARLLDAP